MIIESVILNVKPGLTDSFEADFKTASRYISSIKGYINHSLAKGIETPNNYLLTVHWDELENHTIGFRQSPQYLKWKELLHDYYEPFPSVEHYAPIQL